MALPPTDERLVIVALEMIRKQIADIPLAMAMNLNRAVPAPGTPSASGGSARREAPTGAVTAFDRPQAVLLVGPRPLPVTIVGGAVPGARPTPKDEEEGIGVLSRALRAFLGTFASMLPPIAVFAAIIGSELSGARVLSSALNLFASSVAPVLVPLTFALATGLAAASDMVWRKFAPALEDFYKTMIDTAIPAVEHFADVAGKAAQALVAISKAPGVKGAFQEGGFWGGLNRWLEGLPHAALGEKTPGVQGNPAQRIDKALDDFVRVMSLGNAEPALQAKGWLQRKLSMGAPQSEASDEAKRATAQAELDTKREMLFQLGSTGGVGSIKGNFAAAQTASTSLSPFQAKVLDRLQQTVAALERATQRGARDPYPSGGSGEDFGGAAGAAAGGL